MAIQLPDRNPGGPSALSNDKDVHVKVIQLTSADFTTGGAASVKAVLAADASILRIDTWKRTQLSGGGITAATLSIGVPGAPTQFTSAADVFTPTPGTTTTLVAGNIMQPYNVPYNGVDIQLLFTGAATTGNPTAGEIEVAIYFVR